MGNGNRIMYLVESAVEQIHVVVYLRVRHYIVPFSSIPAFTFSQLILDFDFVENCHTKISICVCVFICVAE